MNPSGTGTFPTSRALPWVLVGLAIAVVLVNSVRSAPGPPAPPLPYFDKVLHLLYFGLIATLLYRLPPLQARTAGGIFAILGAVAVGISDELLQAFSEYRTPDPLDGLFNLIGATLAVGSYRYFGWYRRLLEHRLF